MDSIKKKMEKLANETAAAEARIAAFEDLKAKNEAEAEKFEEQLEQARLQAHTTRKDLLKATQAANPDVANVVRLTQQLISQRAKLTDIESARENAVRAVLKPVEFAKLVLAWPKINREIREEIYRVLLKKTARQDDI